MSGSLFVAIFGDGPDARQQHSVLATLPNSFRATDRGLADIVHVSGRDGTAGEALAAIDARIRGVMITSPSMLAPAIRAAISQAAKTFGIPVRVALAGTPPAPPEPLSTDTDSPRKVEILHLSATVAAPGPDELREAALEMLVLGRQLLGPAHSIRVLFAGSRALTIEVMSGAPVLAWRLTARTGVRPQIVIESISREERKRTSTTMTPIGSPATVLVAGPDGALVRMPIFESAHRRSWVSLEQAVQACVSPTDELLDASVELGLLSRGFQGRLQLNG